MRCTRAPRVAPDQVALVQRRLGGRHLRLLVLLEDWCGDAVNTVPYLDVLAGQVEGLQLRVVRRDLHLELVDRHLTHGARAIPIVIVLNDQLEEIGWWGPRPAELQAWVRSEAAQQLDKASRYLLVRRWYVADRGRSTVAEVSGLLEEGFGPRPAVAGLARDLATTGWVLT